MMRSSASLYTDRLELKLVPLSLLEAIEQGERGEVAEWIAGEIPEGWSGKALIERAFGSPLERVRRDPGSVYWGVRLMIDRIGDRRLIGSVVLNGRPDPSGTVEVGYGVETWAQHKGYAAEGVQAVIDWALIQPEVSRVVATTFPWHRASLRVIEKLGMRLIGTVPHDLLGDLLRFERKTDGFSDLYREMEETISPEHRMPRT